MTTDATTVGTATVATILSDIIAREGGYVDHPADRGGPTRWGITLQTLREWRHPVLVTQADLQHLPVSEALAIYERQYVEGPGYRDAIADPRLLALVVDYAVHSGPGRATKALQRALDVTDDGILGPETKLALGQRDARLVYRRLLADRLKALYRLASDDPSQRVFVDGWFNRVVQFV